MEVKIQIIDKLYREIYEMCEFNNTTVEDYIEKLVMDDYYTLKHGDLNKKLVKEEKVIEELPKKEEKIEETPKKTENKPRKKKEEKVETEKKEEKKETPVVEERIKRIRQLKVK